MRVYQFHHIPTMVAILAHAFYNYINFRRNGGIVIENQPPEKPDLTTKLIRDLIASMAGPEAADEIARIMATAPPEERQSEMQLRKLLTGDTDDKAGAMRYFKRQDGESEQPTEQDRLDAFMEQPLSGTEAREALLSTLQIIPGSSATFVRRQYNLPDETREHDYSVLNDPDLTALHYDVLATVLFGSIYMTDQVIAQNRIVTARRVMDSDGQKRQVADGIVRNKRGDHLTPDERKQVVGWAFSTAQTLVMNEFERHESLRTQLRGETDNL